MNKCIKLKYVNYYKRNNTGKSSLYWSCIHCHSLLAVVFTRKKVVIFCTSASTNTHEKHMYSNLYFTRVTSNWWNRFWDSVVLEWALYKLPARVCVLSCTVKPVYKDHSRDQQNVVLIHRCSLYAGSIAWQIYTCVPVKCGLYKQVVFIYRCFLEQGWLYKFVFYFWYCYTKYNISQILGCT